MDPEPSSSSPSSPRAAGRSTTPPSNTNRTITRSCYSCNKKKIRCDKTDPCSACTRAARPCVFPPQGPRIRRTKRTIIADMSSRLSDLEKSLSRARDKARSPSIVEATRSATKTPLPARNSPYGSPLTDGSREDVLVQSGSSSHYFNEVLLSRAIRDVSRIKWFSCHLRQEC